MNVGEMQRKLSLWAEQDRNHRFYDLYHLLYDVDWLLLAHDYVSQNAGSKTAGCDGINMKAFDENHQKNIQKLAQELKEETFEPHPVRRVYIEKKNGKLRPLGIHSIRDRIVQEAIRMILEPIYEADFSQRSFGFRPNRCTMDAIIYITLNTIGNGKYHWIIEGDISSYFDHIHHEILGRLLAERIADQRLLDLVDRFLKAGIMEGSLFKQTELGTPQGAICSPLLANIYLHQFDLYWWNKYGSLNRKEKERRRKTQQGNVALIRYADDWLLLTNGGKAKAYHLRDEFQTFLWEELKLELSVEKTHITHVNDGFDFLGFHVRRYVSKNDRPKLFVTPSEKAQKKLKAKVKEMTSRKRFRDSPLLKFSALNAVLRGWMNYYRHCNAKEAVKDLDYWVNERLFLWLQKRHRLSARRILKMYKHRENGTRYNLGIQNGEKWLFLY